MDRGVQVTPRRVFVFDARLYILDGKTPVPEPDLLKWSEWFANADADRQVADTVQGDVRVSTIFLGLDQNHFGPTPLLFETMVFRAGKSAEMDRYSTWEEAEKGHAEMVKLALSKRYQRIET
jgi:hypothetical protein